MRGVDAGLLPFSISQADFLVRCATVGESEVKRVAGLTDKQRRFVDEYLVDLNATQAAKRAGYKDPNIGRQLITKNNVSEEIQRRKKELSDRTGITQERVLREFAKIAFFDPRKLFQDNGQPKDITMLDDDTAGALAGLDVMEVYEGHGQDREFVGYTKKYKIADKLRALDALGKHLGLFEKDGADQEPEEGGVILLGETDPEPEPPEVDDE